MLRLPRTFSGAARYELFIQEVTRMEAVAVKPQRTSTLAQMIYE